jgi:hypothetical protein
VIVERNAASEQLHVIIKGGVEERDGDEIEAKLGPKDSFDARAVVHAGGNATGVSYMSTDLAAKRLGLLHELKPHVRRFSMLVNPRGDGAERLTKQLKETEEIASYDSHWHWTWLSSQGDSGDSCYKRRRQLFHLQGE